jgi:hypothetical protein
MRLHDWFFQQTSQALGFLSMLGVAASVIRWKAAVRKDILLAFAIYLLGASMRESVVYYYGGTPWDGWAFATSGISRVIQLVGVTLFLRAALSDHCPPWAQWCLFGAVIFFVMVA